MEKSYKDGIMDAIDIVSKWNMTAIHSAFILPILDQLNKLLESRPNDD